MVREIESGNLVFEPRYQGGGQGRTVVYTPEGEYLLDVEVTYLDDEIHEGTQFSFAMDAGVVESGGFKELFDEHEIDESMRMTNQVPDNDYLGTAKGSEMVTGMKLDWYKIKDSDWTVGVQNPAQVEYPARLNINGFSTDVEEVARDFSRYAEKVGVYSLSHSSRHEDGDFCFDESDISGWNRGDWADVIYKAVEEAVEATPDLEDEISLED